MLILSRFCITNSHNFFSDICSWLKTTWWGLLFANVWLIKSTNYFIVIESIMPSNFGDCIIRSFSSMCIKGSSMDCFRSELLAFPHSSNISSPNAPHRGVNEYCFTLVTTHFASFSYFSEQFSVKSYCFVELMYAGILFLNDFPN